MKQDMENNLYAIDQRDDEHDGHSGPINGYLSIRYGYLQFHYSKEDWMTVEVSLDELSAKLKSLEK